MPIPPWPNFTAIYVDASNVKKEDVAEAHTSIRDELKRISEMTDRSPDLTLDGATVQHDELETLIDQAIAAKARVLRVTTSGSDILALGGRVTINQPNRGQDFLLDLRFCRVRFTTDTAQFMVAGDQNEFPASNPYVPASAISNGATTVNVDTSPQGGDMSRFFVGGTIVIREGSNKHESKITAISGSTVTFADNTTTSFSTSATIHIHDEWALNADAAAGTSVLSVNGSPSTSGLAVGDHVIVQDDKTAGDVQGSSTNRVNIEPVIVTAVTTTSITIDRPLERTMTTAKAARVTKILPSFGVGIIGPPQLELSVAPSSVTSLFEAKMAVETRFVRPGIVETENAYASIGHLVRLENCLDASVIEPYRVGSLSSSDATSGRRYGIYAVGCRDTRIVRSRFVRCRHGIVAGSSCTGFQVLGGVFEDCLVNGVDTHGGDNIGVSVVGATFSAGPSRASDASNQRAISIGNATHQAGDRHVAIAGCFFEGFKDSTGAVEIRTPSGSVHLSALHFKDCADAVTLKETGAIEGGAVFVDTITMSGSTGYAVDDDTTSTKFSRLSLGTVLTDGSEAGIHSQGASGAALRPDLVPNKGTTVEQTKQITTTPYSASRADRWLAKNGFDVVLTALEAAAGNTTAQQIDLHNDAKPGEQVIIKVPDTKTADLTIGLQTGAAFQDGGTTWKATAPFGNGVERKLVFECVQNVGGASAVWKAGGDVKPKDGYYSLQDPLVGPVGQSGTTQFNANYTLTEADQGKLLEFTGTTAATLTLPSSWTGVREIFPVFNTGSAALTVSGGTSGSMTVAAGEAATVVRADSQWRVLPGGAYVVMT